MSDTALEATGIEKSYVRGAIRSQVLKAVDFRARAGALTLVMGPSGSGKSTLLAILSGLLRQDGGRVTALGTDLWSLSDVERDRFRLDNCGFVFQGFHLFPALSALEQVALVLHYQDHSRADAVKLAERALSEVGLSKHFDKRPSEMSGGERQRVAIARAIAKAPKLIFADEPTSALDKESGQAVTALLQRAARVHGAMVLCVTHDHRLEPFADDVVALEDGRVAKPGLRSLIKLD